MKYKLQFYKSFLPGKKNIIILKFSYLYVKTFFYETFYYKVEIYVRSKDLHVAAIKLLRQITPTNFHEQ